MTTIPTDTTVLYPRAASGSTRRRFLTPIPSAPGEFLLVLDNTGMEKIKRCHMAGRNYLILGREPHAKNSALTFGGAVHEALELFHQGEYYRQNPTELDTLLGKDLEKFQIESQTSVIHSFFSDNPAPPDEFRTAQSACEVLKHYRQRCNPGLYPDYEWEIMADAKGPIIERAFELPLGTIEIEDYINADFLTTDERAEIQLHQLGEYHRVLGKVYCIRIHIAWSGRIDLITRHAGHVRITDHKTSSIDRDDFMQQFHLASQTIGYTWAAQQLWPDLDISGFCLNCLNFRKPAKSHVGELTSRGPKGGEAPLNFFRAYFDYSPLRVSEWYSRTMTTIEDFLHSFVRDYFPLNDHACFDKFGRCPYHDICLEDSPEVASALLSTDAFKQVTWNPTTGR